MLEHESHQDLSLEQKTPEEIYNEGLRQFEEGLYDEAIAVLEKSDITNLSVQYVLGNCYFEKEDYIKALQCFDKILDAKPNRPEITLVLNQCAICYMQVDNFQKAIEYVKKAHELEENGIQTLTNYGILLYETKKYPEAHKVLKKALTIRPKNPIAASYMQNLEKLGYKDTPQIPSSNLTLFSIGG